MVGGTNYYIESLLWDILVSPTDSGGIDELPTTTAATAESADSNNVTTVSGNLENVCTYIFLVFKNFSFKLVDILL